MLILAQLHISQSAERQDEPSLQVYRLSLVAHVCRSVPPYPFFAIKDHTDDKKINP